MRDRSHIRRRECNWGRSAFDARFPNQSELLTEEPRQGLKLRRIEVRELLRLNHKRRTQFDKWIGNFDLHNVAHFDAEKGPRGFITSEFPRNGIVFNGLKLHES